MGVISEALRSVVDVGKEVVPKLWKELTDRGIIAKEVTALENYAKRVADRFVNQDDSDVNKWQMSKNGSGVKSLGDIMKDESGKLGREMLMGLIPLAPTVAREPQNQSTSRREENDN